MTCRCSRHTCAVFVQVKALLHVDAVAYIECVFLYSLYAGGNSRVYHDQGVVGSTREDQGGPGSTREHQGALGSTMSFNGSHMIFTMYRNTGHEIDVFAYVHPLCPYGTKFMDPIWYVV